MDSHPLTLEFHHYTMTGEGSDSRPIATGESSRRGCPRNSIFTEVCGIVKPSKLPPGATPKLKFSEQMGSNKYHCCLCGRTFSRIHSVKTHFVRCVERNGNPEGKAWNHHPSVANYRPRQVKSQYQLDRRSFKQLSTTGRTTSQGLVLPSGKQPLLVDPALGGTLQAQIENARRNNHKMKPNEFVWPTITRPSTATAAALGCGDTTYNTGHSNAIIHAGGGHGTDSHVRWTDQRSAPAQIQEYSYYSTWETPGIEENGE